MTLSTLLFLALEFAILFPAIILHEVAHGYAAYLLGDDTAKNAGRLTLNPLKHVDPVGTVILPLVMLLISQGTFFFGWAKPVPFNPWRFKNQRTGMAIVGGAGPATNITLAILAGVISRFLPVADQGATLGVFDSAASFLLYFAYSNLVLAFFNLVPIPPLDGSRLLQAVLPDAARDAYHRLEPYGFVILIGLSWLVPGLFSGYLSMTVQPVFRAITGLG